MTLPRARSIGNSRVSVGRFTYGDENISIHEWGEGANLSIGAFCSIASNVSVFLGGNHRTDWISTFPFGHIYQEELGGEHIVGHPATRGDVSIGNDVWIGHGVSIMSGVTVGDGAVVAANSHVASDVAPFEIVGGNPARHIRFRFTAEVRDLLFELRWWDGLPDEIRAMTSVLCAPPDPIELKAWIRRKSSPR